MNSTNETKMDMKQAKQNSTPNIRWTLVDYDLIIYVLVAVISLVLYGRMDKLSTVRIFQQVGLSVLCIFTARLVGKITGKYGDMCDSGRRCSGIYGSYIQRDSDRNIRKI